MIQIDEPFGGFFLSASAAAASSWPAHCGQMEEILACAIETQPSAQIGALLVLALFKLV